MPGLLRMFCATYYIKRNGNETMFGQKCFFQKFVEQNIRRKFGFKERPYGHTITYVNYFYILFNILTLEKRDSNNLNSFAKYTAVFKLFLMEQPHTYTGTEKRIH